MDRVVAKFQVKDIETGTVFDVVEYQKFERQRDERGRLHEIEGERRLELAAAPRFHLTRVDATTFLLVPTNRILQRL